MRVRWGLAGTGTIARAFAAGLSQVEGAVLQAVVSRDRGRAEAFRSEMGAAEAYADWNEFLASEVDVVYIASPHSEHCRQAESAVRAGKHTLVEKPFGLSAAQARAVFEAAAEEGVFVMEALWSRFLPAHERLRGMVAAGEIGEVRSVEASFGFPFPGGEDHRLLNPSLGGGALLDLGIYPINTAVQLLGPPRDVAAVATLGPTGVDIDTAVVMRFPTGALASATCSLTTRLPCTARVIGTDGWLEVPAPQHRPDALIVRRPEAGRAELSVERIDVPTGEHGLHHQVREVHRCLAEGRQQSPIMSWQHTLDLLNVLDAARSAMGVVYPVEDGHSRRLD